MSPAAMRHFKLCVVWSALIHFADPALSQTPSCYKTTTVVFGDPNPILSSLSLFSNITEISTSTTTPITLTTFLDSVAEQSLVSMRTENIPTVAPSGTSDTLLSSSSSSTTLPAATLSTLASPLYIQVSTNGAGNRARSTISYVSFSGNVGILVDFQAQVAAFQLVDGYLTFEGEFVGTNALQGYTAFTKFATPPAAAQGWTAVEGGRLGFEDAEFCTTVAGAVYLVFNGDTPFECQLVGLVADEILGPISTTAVVEVGSSAMLGGTTSGDLQVSSATVVVSPTSVGHGSTFTSKSSSTRTTSMSSNSIWSSKPVSLSSTALKSSSISTSSIGASVVSSSKLMSSLGSTHSTSTSVSRSDQSSGAGSSSNLSSTILYSASLSQSSSSSSSAHVSTASSTPSKILGISSNATSATSHSSSGSATIPSSTKLSSFTTISSDSSATLFSKSSSSTTSTTAKISTTFSSKSSSSILSRSSSSISSTASLFSTTNTATSSSPSSSSSSSSSSFPPSSSTSLSFLPSPYGLNSGKRGLVYTNITATHFFSHAATPPDPPSHVSWAYNYYSLPNASNDFGPVNPALTFVPLLYSDADSLTSVFGANVNQIIDLYGTDAILAFNEPDACNNGQSACMLNITLAVDAYKSYVQPFAGMVRLGAPAVTNTGPPAGLTYLSYFIGNCTDCTIDFIPLHWYASPYNFQYLMDYVNEAYLVGGNRPIWLTELGMDSQGYPEVDVERFMKNASTWLDGREFVERYAWFGDFNGYLLDGDGSGLSVQGGIWDSYDEGYVSQ